MRLVATMPLLGLLGMRPVMQPARRAAQALGGRVRMMSADFEQPAQLTCVPEWLEARVQSALVEAYGDEYANTDPLITPATKAEFGDYQCNVAMSLAKRLKSSPRDVAATIVATVKLDEYFETPEIAGPGFLNLRLTEPFLQSQLRAMLAGGEKCGVPPATVAQSVVVDYSSPNIAKEMHVGHLRSTIIGDALARVLELRGHRVVRLNHVGDWGTQFGMLITLLKREAPGALSGEETLDISDLVAFYKRAKAVFDTDDDFKDEARRAVVKLQAGDEASLTAWRLLCAQSQKAFAQVYGLLAVDERLEVRGESFYNERLPGTVEALREAKVLEESDGAQCVFVDGFTNREGERQPLIVVKSDGGYMYSTTDLAAIAQRATEEKAERVLYITDAGQAQHFAQVFATARKAELAPATMSLEHVPFGLVLGEDGKKFKTRSGETVKLISLLEEAMSRARADLESRLASEERDETEDFIARTSQAVGIGATKYADLSMNRNSNYRFSYDKMLALNGNTAPYMMYAYVRTRGIERRASTALAGLSDADLVAGDLELGAAQEQSLARHLVRLPEIILEVERDLLPSKLCDYIYELSQRFNRFYEECPVLDAPTPTAQRTRLALCRLTAATLRLNLELLGIETLDRL